MQSSVELNIPVITYGIKTNFEKEVFPSSLKLFAKADKVEELAVLPLCKCGNKSCFNAHKVNGEFTFEDPEISIDGSKDEVEYQSLCGKCYDKEMKKQNDAMTKIIYRRKKVLKREQ